MNWSRGECYRQGNENLDDQTLRKTLGDGFYYLTAPDLKLSGFLKLMSTNDVYTLHEYHENIANIRRLIPRYRVV